MQALESGQYSVVDEAQDAVRFLTARDVSVLLESQQGVLMELVRLAYLLHAQGQSVLPQSVFLHPPSPASSRIIALPAFLGGQQQVAGLKWIASFPTNIERGLPRASGLIILNSPETGRPFAVLEAAQINAARTAASAVLAARHLCLEAPEQATLVGCGVINLQVARFLRGEWPGLRRLLLFDPSRERAVAFGRRCTELLPGVVCQVLESPKEVTSSSPLLVYATNAATPHVEEPPLREGVILHVSLRDLSPSVIASCDNVVDDADHVCRAQTSLHLAEQQTGDRTFIRGTLADLLQGRIPARVPDRPMCVFSPFGLGVLDLVVARYVHACAVQAGFGRTVPRFFDPG